MKKVLSRWYLLVIGGFLLAAMAVFLLCGEDSVIAVHDNLDLFIPQLQMMKSDHSFFSHDAYVNFLGGISRDTLFSEFYIYTILFMLLPAFPAYIAAYFLKILIAIAGSVLLGRELLGEKYKSQQALVWLCGFAYGILNVFPAFGIPFASIPLLLFLLVKIMRKPSWGLYAALFFYPVLSYFSYFGLFILAYMALAFVILWIRDRKFPGRMLLAIIVLSVGYIVCEYRLFYMMLFDDEVTIRSTIVAGNYTISEVLATIGDSLVKGMFHAESVHMYVVLPVCAIYFFYLNISYLVKKNARGIFHDWYNLLMLILVFNSLIYGIYYLEPVRNVVEFLCPPLTGWQFNRTIFFNPFVWYAAFFLVLKRLYEKEKKGLRVVADLLALAAVLVILGSNTRYNDLYHTCFSKVYEMVKGQKANDLTYREFYSTDLFEKAKEDIGYCGQWSVAYGFYPAILEYNDIATLDGYLGFYSQNYKEEFRKMIAPALDRVEESRLYFDEWGARAYLYSGTDPSIINSSRIYEVTDHDLYLDVDQFKRLGGRYIFSRIDLGNAEEIGLTLIGTYTDETSPYTLYVYQTTSRYRDVDHANLTLEEMKQTTCDMDLLDAQLTEMKELAAEAEESGAAEKPERVKELFGDTQDEIEKLSTCYSLSQITYYQNIFDEENQEIQAELLDDVMDYGDRLNVAIRELCKSPYQDTMIELMNAEQVEAYLEYEEMTDAEKELTAKENSLEQEYEQLSSEEFYYEYDGEEWDLNRLNMEADEMDHDAVVEIYQGICKQRNDAVGEVFVELVDVRNEIAKLNGYDNYAEYAYDAVYVRDYTLDETRDLLKEIRKHVVPVMADMKDVLYDTDYMRLYSEGQGIESTSIIEQIGPYLEEIDPELKDTQEHFLKYRLYDMDTSQNKANTAFTMRLSYFKDGFIYGQMYDNYMDYYNVIHEFGHYNNVYRSADTFFESSNNIDVSEIHSQGMQMLFYDYYDELLGEDIGDIYAFYDVYSMADNAISTALVSEFEIAAYENPDMTLEELNKLYLQLSRRYGMQYDSQIKELYTWSEIPHIFTSPCYYFSYLTSAFSSLDILTMAESDRHEAVETYMTLTTIPGYVPYCSAVEYAGLRDIFDDGVAQDIIEETASILGVKGY